MNTDPVRTVTIEAFAMALPFCGFKEYVSRIGTGFAARARDLRQRYGLVFRFVVPPGYDGCFGPDVDYLVVRESDRLTIESDPRWVSEIFHMPTQHVRFRQMKRAAHNLLTIHDVNFMHSKGFISRTLHKLRLRARVRKATDIVYITHFAAFDTMRVIGTDKPFRVIHNGVTDINTIVQHPVEGLEPGFLLHISSLMSNKRPELLVNMMGAMPGRRLVIAGNLANAPYLEKMAADHPNVTLVNGITDNQKAWLYAHCSAFLFPSECEGFGLPPIEAMTMGKPVVMSRLTSLPEVGASVARYWDSHTPEAMARIVERALRDHNASPEASAARIKANAARFNWDKCVDDYIDYYLDMLGIDK